MIKSLIYDTNNNHSVNVNRNDKVNGLIVDTRPYKTFDDSLQFFTNNKYGKNLAQNGTSIGTPELVHNGEDDILWNATIITSNINDFDFNSTDVAHTGTQSIDCTDSEGDDIFQLEKPSGTLSPVNYNTLTGWIYITGLWGLPGDGLEIILYNTITGIQVSENSVNLNNYIDGDNTNVWQKFTIPMINFGITTDFNALRCTILQDGSPPNFYLDDIQFEANEGDGPLIYTVKPTRQTWFHIDAFVWTYVDEYDSALLNSTMPKIPYNGFFNVDTLNSGLVYQRVQNNEIILSASLKRHLDIMEFGVNELAGYGFDGTYSWVSIKMMLSNPIILKEENDDYLQIIVSDNLSGLEEFSVRVSGKTELRNL